MILISLIGATVDSSIAISSALYEVYDNNKNLSKKRVISIRNEHRKRYIMYDE